METSKRRNSYRYGNSSDGLVTRYIPRPLLRQSCHNGIEEGRQSNSARDRVVVKAKHAYCPPRAEPRASSSSRARSDIRASSVTRRGTQASRDIDRVSRSKRSFVRVPPGEGLSLDRGFSVGPSDFDSRASVTRITIPTVGLSAGAAAAESARVGWSCSNIHLRRQMCTQSAHEGNLVSGKGCSPSNRMGGSSVEEQTKTRRKQRLRPGDVSGDNSHRRAHSTSKQKRRDFNGVEESRKAATKRAAAKEVIRQLILRVQVLWQELRVPHPDRAHMTATYLAGGSRVEVDNTTAVFNKTGDNKPTSDQVRNELVRQIEILLNYRTATVKVLRCIASREARLEEVEQVLQAFWWHRGRDTDALGSIDALAGLRDASVDVVLAVLEWRKQLRQPRAFCWRGVNYLEKMSRDTTFLCSPVGRSLLAAVGLGVEDMTLILFRASGCKSLGVVELSGVRPPPAMVRLTPRAELVEEYRARFFGQPAGVVIEEGHSRQIETGEEKTRIVEVVTKEPELQRRVREKRERLAAKGCFVPLLRRLPVDGRPPARDRQRRTSSNEMSAPFELRNDASKAHHEGRYVSTQGVKGRTLDEGSLPQPSEERNQMSTGFEMALESSFRSPTEAVGETLDGKSERPDPSGYFERDDDLSVDSRRAPEKAATTMTKEEKNDQGHAGQQQVDRDEYETVLPERETGRQDINDRIEPPDVPIKPNVFSEVRDAQSDMGRQDEAGQAGRVETPMGGVNAVGRTSFLGIARGSGSGHQGQDHMSVKGVSGSSWMEQVGRGGEGDREGEKKQSETGVLHSDFSEEDNVTVTNSLLYDDDFEEGRDDDYRFFTESERDDDSHPNSNLGEDSQHDEVNSNDGHASVKPDEDDSVHEDGSVHEDDSVHEEDSVHDDDSDHEDEDSRTRGSKAVVIQRAWRRRAARKHQKELRRRRFELDNAVAIRIHKVAKAYAEKWQESLLLEEKSARKLQAWLTARRVEREAQCHRTERNAVVRIQSAFRGKRARDEAREHRREREARKVDAAVKIQDLARKRTAQALLAENSVSAVHETEAPSSREEDRVFEESASEIGEREGGTTQLTERRSAQTPVRGESGSGLLSLEEHLSKSGSGRKENGAESSILDGSSAAVAPATSPSLPTRAPASTDSSWSLSIVGFRSSSSASVTSSRGWSGNEEFSLGGDSSSSRASDRLLRDTRQPQQEERNEGDVEGGLEKLDKSMVENEAYLSKRSVAVNHDEDVSQARQNFVTKEETEGDTERLSTTVKLNSRVDELPDDANTLTMQNPHDSGQENLENVVSRGAERITASVPEEAMLTVNTKTIAASIPEHEGPVSGEASEYGSEDIKFDSLSSSSSSRLTTRTAEIGATNNGEFKDVEESPKAEPMVVTKPAEPVQGAQVEETKGEFDDSSDSLLSFGMSDSSS